MKYGGIPVFLFRCHLAANPSRKNASNRRTGMPPFFSLSGILAALLLAAACLPAIAAAPPPTLFADASVITMGAEGTLPRHDVLVADGRIVRIAPTGTIAAPQETRRVDASGRYLLPGLAEMHAHLPGPDRRQYAEDVLLLYVAHGITTVRGMLGHPWHLELRESTAKRDLLGPRIYTAGPSLNGGSAPDVATARRMVREQKAAGYDFLKLHPGLKREVFDAIADEARSAGIPFSGHVSEDVGLAHALAAGQRAVDHLDGYMQVLLEPGCFDGPVAAGIFGIGLTRCASVARIPEVVQMTRASGAWMAPTEVLLERWVHPPDLESLRRQPASRYVSGEVLQQWYAGRVRFLGAAAIPEDIAGKFVSLRRELIRQLHAAGVPILLASDAPQVFTVPGESALAELELYVAAGLQPDEALATGTVNPARFYDAGDVFGTIREGLEADLVMLDGNPLEDISQVRRIAGVMLRGRWLDRAELDSRLDELAARQR
jgi:imidazolonepropionase-like amidohydrolase